MTTNAKADRVPNYTKEQEAMIINASPLNLVSAKLLGEEMGKSYRSIIAKAHSLGLDYEAKKPEKKRVIQTTKAELVDALSESLNGANLNGLEKATAASLKNLQAAINAI
jgi:hypothetical protein